MAINKNLRTLSSTQQRILDEQQAQLKKTTPPAVAVKSQVPVSQPVNRNLSYQKNPNGTTYFDERIGIEKPTEKVLALGTQSYQKNPDGTLLFDQRTPPAVPVQMQSNPRLPASRATPENPVITPGKPLTIPNRVVDDRQREIDLMVKTAKGEQYNDDDLKFMAEQQLKARDAMPLSTPVQKTVQDIANMNPQERMQYEKQAFDQNVKDQMGMFDQFGQQTGQFYDDRQKGVQDQIEKTRMEEEARNQQLVEAFRTEQEAQATGAKEDVIEAGQEGMDKLQRNQARRGMSRSSSADNAIVKATKNTQKLVDQIERDTGNAVTKYQVDLLDKMDQKISKLEDRALNLGDQKAAAELGMLQERQKTYVSLMSQSPNNPVKMAELADKLKSQQLAEAKENNAEARALRQEAFNNLQWQITTSGSGFLDGMTPEQISNMAINAGLNPAALLNMGATLKEQEMASEEMRWIKDKEFDIAMQDAKNAFEERMFDKGFQKDMNLLGMNFSHDESMLGKKAWYDQQTENVKNQGQWGNLGYAGYSAVANGADGSQLTFEQPTPWGNTEVIAGNPKLKNAALPGQVKGTGKDYVGQCAYEAQQMVKLSNGRGWKLGNSLQEKKNSLAQYVKKGDAFYPGQKPPMVGQAIVTNESPTYGHVAVINAIKPDGTLILSEYNYGGKREFKNSREMPANSPKILGFMNTQPAATYQVAQNVEKLAQDVTKNQPLLNKLGQVTSKTFIGQMFGAAVVGAKQQAMDQTTQATGIDEASANDQFGEEQAAMNQKIQSGETDENGAPLSEFRKALRAGQIDQTVLNDMMKKGNVPPEFYQDIAFAKNNMMGGDSATNSEIRQVRQEYNKIAQATGESNKFSGQLDTTWKAYQAGKIDKGTADNAIIMLFSKMLDPGSVVREGEFDRVVAGQPLLTYAQNLVASKASGGYALDDKTRSQLVTLAQEYAAAQNQKLNQTTDFYNQEAKYMGVPSERITGAYDYLNNSGTQDISEYQSQLQPGEILVKDSEGNIGAVTEWEFDPSLYTKI